LQEKSKSFRGKRSYRPRSRREKRQQSQGKKGETKVLVLNNSEGGRSPRGRVTLTVVRGCHRIRKKKLMGVSCRKEKKPCQEKAAVPRKKVLIGGTPGPSSGSNFVWRKRVSPTKRKLGTVGRGKKATGCQKT